jgi:ABC-type glycerol-3-phosphate transport system substrate-binding protein
MAHYCRLFPRTVNLFRLALVALWLGALPASVSAQSNWQTEWQKTLRAAESEGQLTLYGCCYEYERVTEPFKKKYPKIKVTTVISSGGQLASRILAERRGEKYIPDVVSSGANTLHDALYKGHVLEPIQPALILPEVLDQTKWYQSEHRYIDPEKRFIFALSIRPGDLQC